MFKKIFCFLIFITLTLCLTRLIFAAGLIQNPDFEDGIQNWRTNNSAIIFSIVDEEVFQGTQSAKIFNPKNSSYGIEQTITDISSTLNYQIKTNLKLISPYPEKAFLRVAWYKSFDASGSQSSTDDSNYATASSDWQEISLIKNPSEGINSAKIRLLVASGSAYFDNVVLIEHFEPTIAPTLTEISTPTPEPTNIPTPSPLPISYDNIFISEVMTYPDINQKEWLEIFNNNDFDVELVNWYVDDQENSGTSPKIFSLTLPAKSYGVVELNSAMFNNDNDTVRLLDFDKKEKDGFEYDSNQKNKTWGRNNFANNEFCLQEASRGKMNNPCLYDNDIKESSMTSPTPNDAEKTEKPITFKTLGQVSNEVVYPQKYENQPIGQVLGAETNVNGNFSPAINSLSLTSFSYSLLTIASVLLKIKKWI